MVARGAVQIADVNAVVHTEPLAEACVEVDTNTTHLETQLQSQ